MGLENVFRHVDPDPVCDSLLHGKLATDAGLLSFLSTTTVFGMPRDILLSEIAIEAFFPADAETGRLLRRCDGP